MVPLVTKNQILRRYSFINPKSQTCLALASPMDPSPLKKFSYRSEPFRWDEYQNKLYLLYVQFITGLQAGVLPAVLILKKMKISFIQEMLIEANT